MKRIITILLAAALLAGLCLTASADTQSMLETVRIRVGDTSGYTKFSSDSWTDGGKTRYSFYWSTEEPYTSLNVTITESGIVTSYDCYDGSDDFGDTPTLNRPSQQKALESAKAFLAKIDPDVAPEIELTAQQDSLYNRGYTIRGRRMHGGVPVMNDTCWLRLAQDGETVVSFNLNWTEGLSFEDAAGAISKEAAQKAYAEQYGMRLQYRMDYRGKEPVVQLVYAPVSGYGEYISALTGEKFTVTDPSGDYKRAGNSFTTAEAAEDADAAGFGGFTEVEQAELDTLSGLLSREEQEKRLRANPLLTLQDMQVSYYRRGKDTFRGIYCDTLGFEGENRSATVTVNAADGQILRYYFYHDQTVKLGSALTEAQALELAKKAAATLAGELLSQYREQESERGAYYVRYVNDVPFDHDSVSAYVEPETGLLTSYSIGMTDREFPSPAGAISAGEAAAAMFRQVDYVLTYVPTSRGGKGYDTAALVYALENGSYSLLLDPFTGDLLHTEEQRTLPEYTDISGHYAETAINALRAYGVGFDAAEYRPNDTITQGEYVTLLQGVFGGYGDVILYAGRDYAKACEDAVRSGILKVGEYDADAPLTRETSAVLMIRALGLDEVASLPGIYVSPFTDVSGAHVGHIAILSAMGVFRGNGKGGFMPAKNLTRGDAAIVLYQYLTK